MRLTFCCCHEYYFWGWAFIFGVFFKLFRLFSFGESKRAGEKVNLDVALDSYYASMGWDKETGLPTKETLCRLGLDWIEL
jgi:hypothetical protein